MSNDDFTYESPDEKAYFNTLVKYLRTKGENEIIDLLKGAKCSIRSSSTFSKRRWNAVWTTIYFYVPIDKLEFADEEIKQKLTKICDGIMPAEVGFDVMDVEFSPLIAESYTEETLIGDLEDITKTISQEIINQILPNDIKQKGSYPIGIVKDNRLLALAIALPRTEDSAVFNMRIGSIVWLTIDHSLSCNERKDIIPHLRKVIINKYKVRGNGGR